MRTTRLLGLLVVPWLTPRSAWSQSSARYWSADLECTQARRELPALAPAGTTLPQAIDLRSPRVPEGLPAGQEQAATLLFVVDTDGRVEPCTIQVLQETDRRWTDAAARALVGGRFKPAATASEPIRFSTRQRFVAHP